MWATWTHSEGVPPSGKWGGGVWIGSQMPRQLNIDPPSLVTVATIKTDAAILKAYFGNNQTEMMLDSGSAVSLVRQDIVKSCNIISQMPLPQIQLVTASGDKLPIKDYVRVPIEVQGEKLTHDFLVVDKLITPVILGIDFLQKHGLTLNFSHSPVVISTTTHTASTTTTRDEATDVLKPIWIAHQSIRKKYCGNIGLENQEENINDCTVPKFDQPVQIEFPQCANSTFDCVMQEYRELFRKDKGSSSSYSNQWSSKKSTTKAHSSTLQR